MTTKLVIRSATARYSIKLTVRNGFIQIASISTSASNRTKYFILARIIY